MFYQEEKTNALSSNLGGLSSARIVFVVFVNQIVDQIREKYEMQDKLFHPKFVTI